MNISPTDLVNDPTVGSAAKASRLPIIPAHIFCLLFLCFPAVCSATLILTVWSPDRILIGADGMAIQPDQPQPNKRTCKIRQGASDCFYSVAGAHDDKSIHYDLAPLATQACQGVGSIARRADAFKQVALPEIRREWDHIKSQEPKTYALTKQYGAAHLAVVFAGGAPLTLVILQFVEDSRGQMVPDESIVRDQAFSSKTEYNELGEYLNIDAYREKNPDVDQLDTVPWLRTLLSKAIELEQSEKLKRIGPPISILEITISGARWVEQGDCQNIGDYSLPSIPPDSQ
jgi:hypothetical protein